jgi:hypothetical protein
MGTREVIYRYDEYGDGLSDEISLRMICGNLQPSKHNSEQDCESQCDFSSAGWV